MNESKKIGRPTKYKEEYAELVYKIYLLNSAATDKDVALFFDVEEKTINNWKEEHPEFLQSIREGRVIADQNVAESLYSLTQRRRKNVEKVFVSKGEPIKVDTYEELEPDTKACQLWLMNRRRKDWGGANILDEDGALHIVVAVPAAANAWLSKPTEQTINVTPEDDGESEGSE